MRRVYRLAISRIKPEIKPEVYSRFEKQNKLRLYVYTNECNYDRSEIILRIAPPFGAVSASVSRFRSSIDNTILSLPVPLPPPAAPPAAAAAAAAAAASGLPGAPPGLVPSLGLAPWPMLFTGVDEPSDFSKVTEENLFVNSETFRINACWLSAFSFWISRINPCISTVTCPYTSCYMNHVTWFMYQLHRNRVPVRVESPLKHFFSDFWSNVRWQCQFFPFSIFGLLLGRIFSRWSCQWPRLHHEHSRRCFRVRPHCWGRLGRCYRCASCGHLVRRLGMRCLRPWMYFGQRSCRAFQSILLVQTGSLNIEY